MAIITQPNEIKEPEAKVWNVWEHSGWGNSIDFWDWERRKVQGFLPNSYLFQPGDELRVKMQSGRIGRFRVKDVEYMSDPRDQFFATVEDIGYVDEAL